MSIVLLRLQTDKPCLRLVDVSRVYRTGDTEVRALNRVSLTIERGEYVAIMGQSGSGKSTLMNILGCLDRPTEGCYEVNGTDIARLSANELAAMRRDTFGFVFQRYNLLASISAVENVELPAIYSGRPRAERTQRAYALLARLGIGERSSHRPNQMSGGQQQRVSIARALMNGAEVVLADEPTGALDSRSGEEVLALLNELHQEGRTIILITHDAAVAQHADRVIQIKDGRIVKDSGRAGIRADRAPHARLQRHAPRLTTDLTEAVKMALRALRTDIFRSALTLLGVVIGVAAVVTMLAIGNGSKQEVMENIAATGSNLLLVFPGAPGVRPSGDIATLVPADAQAIEELPGVASVSPVRGDRKTLRYGTVDYQTNVTGVWPAFLQAQSRSVASGSFITHDDVQGAAPVIVLGKTVADNLFQDGASFIGKSVLVGNVPFEVIGALKSKGASDSGEDMDNFALVPLSTGFMRLFGKQYLNSISVAIQSAEQTESTQRAVRDVLRSRHGTEDFQVRSTSSFMEIAASAQNSLTMLLGSIAAISLLVGGIGVMNIMLVNVTERTREIGVRMATGARMSNILLQFNTEALVICGIGGLIGVALGFTASLLVQVFGVRVAITPGPALMAFTSAVVTGLLFGYLPARKAARMDPVVALASE